MTSKLSHTLFGIALLATIVVCASSATAQSRSYLTFISDLVSTSAPGASANHTIRFTLTQALPASGAFELYFNEGGFTIPTSGFFEVGDIDVRTSTSTNGVFTQRLLSTVASPVTDGVTVTTGSSGRIRVKLNSTTGIPAGYVVEVRVGTHASFQATGNAQIQHSATPGSYPVKIRTLNASDVEIDYGATRVVVIEQVTVAPVDTTDTTPPVIVSAEPTGILQVGTRGVQMYLVTDELSSCRFATSSMTYLLMPYSFYGTTSGPVYWHFAQVTGLEDNTDYTYYVRCRDFRLNEIDPDYLLEFTIGVAPGTCEFNCNDNRYRNDDRETPQQPCRVDLAQEMTWVAGGGPIRKRKRKWSLRW